MDLRHDLQFVIEVARSAGAIVLEHYGNVERLTKRQAEAVTEADRASQRHIVAALRRRFGGDGIIGEENETGDAITFDCPNLLGRVWVIDPIDGTNNFVNGLGAFAVCIGLLDQGRPILGVVYDVTRDQMYAAAVGQGAWLDTRKLAVPPTPLNDSAIIMMTSNVLDAQGNCPAYPARWLAQTNWKIRILGSAALEAVSVASGVAHAAITVNGKLWDCVAPAAIVLEAGGSITDFQGRDIFPYDLAGYSGGRVPYLTAAPAAKTQLLDEINR